MQLLPFKVFFGSFALGLGFAILFSTAKNLGMNVLLFQLLLVGIAYWLSQQTAKPFSRNTWIVAAFALAFSATFAIWTSAYGLGLSMFGLIVSNLLFALFLLGHHGKFPHPIHIIIDTLHYIALRTLSRFDILWHIQIPQFSRNTNAIVRGIIIALPILVIFSALFFSADEILRELFVQKFIDSEIVKKRIAQGILVGVITTITLPILASAYWRQITIPAFLKREPKHATETAIVLGLVNALFLAFILFQSYYLFGGASAFDSIDYITYAEYARQGFGELAIISGLVFLLILTVRHFHTEKTHRYIKLLELGLLLQTGLLVISAWQRLHLYVEHYAYTPARLFGFWFFALIIFLLANFAYHISKNDVQERFLKQALLITGIAMLSFTALAPDALTLRLNIARANRTGEMIETQSLHRHLSAEAYPMMSYIYATIPHDPGHYSDPSAISSNQLFVKNNYANRIQERVCEKVWDDKESRNETSYWKTRRSWQEWNLSRMQLPTCTREPQ